MESRSSRDESRRLHALLRTMREEAGIRQVDLAHMLGVPQSFVSKYESGERRLDVIETRAIARALGSSLMEVIDRFERE
ncbi:helix-turn-helix transcriptional regulator [Microbacterium sp. NPDC089188]|uniref:helix-turn-helix domain-containing protein n=1 Tax=Microbacterium sp. NPDC089188 TaxID=3154971 RepID=UPI0034206E9D